MTFRKAVFLDRDGVINQSIVVDGKPYAPRKLSDFKLLPGIVEATHQLKEAGYVLAVVTNQPDIGNGHVESSIVESMHAFLRTQIFLDEIYCCPHAQNAGCECRKPKSGMFRQAEVDFNLDLSQSWMIGDRASDIVAGQTVGSRTIFIDRHYRETSSPSPTAVVSSLPEAAAYVLHHSREAKYA